MATSSWGDAGLVSVGRLLRTRGRVGELIAEIDSSEPGRAERLVRVLLRKSPLIEEWFEVAEVWYHGDKPILRFTGIDSISEAEPWEHAEIFIPAEERVLLEDGAYFDQDLIGCAIEHQGGVLGTVDAVEDMGGSCLLRVLTPAGGEVLIPFARALCPDIDVAAKRIRVELPDGLIDLQA